MALNATLVMAGCGSTGDVPEVTVVDLPVGSQPCPTGGLLIAVDSEEHVLCNGERGAAGETGATGQTGATGPGGKPATEFRPSSIVSCSATFALPSGAPAFFAYEAVAFTDGSKLISCTASTTGLVSGSRSTWYAPWQVGAAAEACLVTSDASGAATAGWWDFRSSGDTYRIRYHDVGTPEDGDYYDFKVADCPTAQAPTSVTR